MFGRLKSQTSVYFGCCVKMNKMIQAGVLLTSFVLCLGSLQHSVKEEFSVYPTILYERASETTLVVKLTDSLTLSLEKSSVLAEEILMITKAETRTEYNKVNASAIQERLYHDPHHQSSLIVLEKDGALHVEGVVNSKLRIKPLPEGPRSSQGHVLHSIYGVTEANEANMKMDSRHRSYNWWIHRPPYPGYRPWAYRTSSSTTTTTTTTARPSKDVFVVELHVVSCQQHQGHFSTNEDLIAYLAVMVNAVNMRYLDMVHPRIRYKLVGITRSLVDQFAKKKYGTILAPETLDSLSRYYYAGYIAGNPDVVYFITSQDLASIKRGKLEKGILGLAYTGAVCTKRGVGEGEDIALSYSGVYCMAHELAHSLGSSHDTTPECPWEEGFLMSYVDGGTKKYRLSRCSEKQIRQTFLRLPPSCISEGSSSNLGDPHTSVPGQKLDEHTYCQHTLRVRNSPAAVTAEKPLNLSSRCKMKCCFSYSKFCEEVDILEGMACINEKTCKRGVCDKHDWNLAGHFRVKELTS